MKIAIKTITTSRRKTLAIATSLLFASSFSVGVHADDHRQDQKWVASFAFSPQGNQILRPPFVANALNNQTVRSIVHLSLGGDTIRVRVSNTFGDKPLTVDAASVGIRDIDSTIVSGSLNILTFGGESSIIIPIGADVFSDPVDLSVANDSDLAINLYVAGESPLPTIDDVANKTSYVSVSGDATTNETMPTNTTVDFSYFTSGVDVLSHRNTRTIVAIGASLTDGFGADLDASNNYPSELARRFLAQPGMKNTSVVNAAISGNRLLAPATVFGPAATARLDSDVLGLSGVTHILIEHGTNDIGLPEIGFILPEGDTADHVTAAQLIAGMKQVITKAHSRDIKVIGGTLLPYKGAAYYTPEGEVKRQALNEWIRTSDAFDGYVDFDAALRDPNDPQQINPALHIGDNLHPNAAGYKAMAHAVDLDLFK